MRECRFAHSPGAVLSDSPISTPLSLTRFNWVLTAYLVALIAAAIVLQWRAVVGDGLLWSAAWADVAGTLVIFGFSFWFRNSSFYDPYWSVVPPLLLLFWWWQGPPLPTEGLVRLLLMAFLTCWWAMRLTHNWARGWHGLEDEDWRYGHLQQTTGVFYWPVSLLGIHLFPTVWVFIGCLPFYLATGAGVTDQLVVPQGSGLVSGLGWLDGAGLLVGCGAVWIERRADNELRQFRASRSSRAELLRTGVWAWCRHPNYLGEIGFWLALALFGAAAVPGVWWVWLGPLVMVLLFAGITIRMIETHLAQSKPDYAEYQQQTPMLLPRPWK